MTAVARHETTQSSIPAAVDAVVTHIPHNATQTETRAEMTTSSATANTEVLNGQIASITTKTGDVSVTDSARNDAETSLVTSASQMSIEMSASVSLSSQASSLYMSTSRYEADDSGSQTDSRTTAQTSTAATTEQSAGAIISASSETTGRNDSVTSAQAINRLTTAAITQMEARVTQMSSERSLDNALNSASSTDAAISRQSSQHTTPWVNAASTSLDQATHDVTTTPFYTSIVPDHSDHIAIKDSTAATETVTEAVEPSTTAEVAAAGSSITTQAIALVSRSTTQTATAESDATTTVTESDLTTTAVEPDVTTTASTLDVITTAVELSVTTAAAESDVNTSAELIISSAIPLDITRFATTSNETDDVIEATSEQLLTTPQSVRKFVPEWDKLWLFLLIAGCVLIATLLILVLAIILFFALRQSTPRRKRSSLHRFRSGHPFANKDMMYISEVGNVSDTEEVTFGTFGKSRGRDHIVMTNSNEKIAAGHYTSGVDVIRIKPTPHQFRDSTPEKHV